MPSPKEKNWAPWVHIGSPHWLPRISIPTCVLYHFWSRLMVGAKLWGDSHPSYYLVQGAPKIFFLVGGGGCGGRRHFDWPITNKFGDIAHSQVKAKRCLALAPHSLKIKAQRFFPLAHPYSLYT